MVLDVLVDLARRERALRRPRVAEPAGRVVKVLVAGSLACLVLLEVRQRMSGDVGGGPARASILVAWVPVLAATAASRLGGFARFASALAWLATMPLAFRLVLAPEAIPPEPSWLDALVLVAVALEGLGLGLLSLRYVHEPLRRVRPALLPGTLVAAAIVIATLGVWVLRAAEPGSAISLATLQQRDALVFCGVVAPCLFAAHLAFTALVPFTTAAAPSLALPVPRAPRLTSSAA